MPRVLVIDDDHAQRFLFAQLLKRTGFDVVSISSGDIALEMLATDCDFSAILTDLSMPGTSGIQLINAIQEKCADVPVIVMSVLALLEWPNPDELSNCVYLQKPFDRERLVEAIRTAMGNLKTLV